MKTQLIKHKSQAALSTFWWGIYMSVNGISLIVYPNGTLATMGFEPTQEIWIRMAGLLALVLGFFYVQLGRFHFTPFYNWKVTGHVVGILTMTLFYLQGLAPSAIFMLCLTDGLAALWTIWGKYQDNKQLQYS